MAEELGPEMMKTLKQKVYVAARDGMAISIFAMLWNLDRTIVKEVLEHETEEDGQKTTPLIIAARNGEEKVVQVLLSNFNVDIEQTGTVKFDGYVIEGATSLWCAAGASHFGIIKYLIDHKADVNHPTFTNSTPLRAACFEGRLDIVEYLIDHKADITIANKYSNTCLMIACYKGHKDVVRYLLHKGADPDCRALCGATALHFAAECGHLDIVQELVESGASRLENDHNMTPLLVASESGKANVVEYFISRPECSRENKIEALELLGASFANFKENYDISKAFLYLRRAMLDRFSDEDNVVRKPVYGPVPAYDNRRECKTVTELDAIERDFNALHMESLTIRERILGPDNPEVPHPVIFRGAVFADTARFDRCIALWMHAMRLRQKNNRTIYKDLLRFAQVFSQMLHLEVTLNFRHVHDVLEHAVIELRRDQERLEKDEDEKETLSEVYQSNIHTALYLIVIALKTNKSSEEDDQLHRTVYSFLHLKPVLKNSYTPLHMAADSATLIDDFHVVDVVSFPNAPLARLLLQCGADPNALDTRNNTPLHVIVRYDNPISDFDTLHQLIMMLIRFGAHMDICNSDGKTPMTATVTGVAEVILRSQMKIRLKCLAAKAVKKHKIDFVSSIPYTLVDFVNLH